MPGFLQPNRPSPRKNALKPEDPKFRNDMDSRRQVLQILSPKNKNRKLSATDGTKPNLYKYWWRAPRWAPTTCYKLSYGAPMDGRK